MTQNTPNAEVLKARIDALKNSKNPLIQRLIQRLIKTAEKKAKEMENAKAKEE